MSLLRNNKLLWVLQILLAALYLFAGGLKIVAAPEDMRAAPTDPIPAGNWLVFLRMIGGFEVLGALGLVLLVSPASSATSHPSPPAAWPSSWRGRLSSASCRLGSQPRSCRSLWASSI